VIACGAINEAMQALNQSRDVHAAVLDIRIGRETSALVAEALRRRGIGHVFYTGQIDPIRDVGTDALVISKPAKPGEIIKAVAALLEGACLPRG
jgi:hypothetical protein